MQRGLGGTACYHDVSISMADEVEGIANSMCSSGAGRRHCMIGAQEAMVHADHTSSHVGQQTGHHKGAQPAKVAFSVRMPQRIS